MTHRRPERPAKPALEQARSVADAEHRIADAEQEIADAETALAAIESEGAAASEDGTAAAVAEPPSQHGGTDRWKADRRRAAEREAHRSLDETPETAHALDRFAIADARDDAARSRDRASEARDHAAATRDRRPPAIGFAPAVTARKLAAADRGHSAQDRAHSGTDRDETRTDRDAYRNALSEAHTDGLTGTYQRAMGLIALQNELDRACRSNATLTLAFVDVDNLKIHNDEFGHAAGDALLRDVAKSMIVGLRSYDPIVRYGGDEFICALAGADVAAAQQRFEEVTNHLRTLRPGAAISVGFALHIPGETLAKLIARGDQALYTIKRARKRSSQRERST